MDELIQGITELLDLIKEVDAQQSSAIKVYKRLVEIQKDQIVGLKQEIRDLKEELELI